jgi:hypothetical protein
VHHYSWLAPSIFNFLSGMKELVSTVVFSQVASVPVEACALYSVLDAERVLSLPIAHCPK